MQSILAACLTPKGEIRAYTIATAIAARTGAIIRWSTPEDAADEALQTKGATNGADLVIVAPRLPEQSSWLGHDKDASTLIQRAHPAVLVVQGPVDWPPRRVLVPLDRDDLRDDTIVDAARWTMMLAGEASSADGPPVDLSVLHVAEDPDELYRDNPRLTEHLDKARDGYQDRLSVRTIHCMRWGARPQKRIAVAVGSHRPTLLIMSRSRGGAESAALVERSWFHAIGESRCPVLLLPRNAETDRPSTVDASWLGALPGVRHLTSARAAVFARLERRGMEM
jgi:hypothetical protein